MKVNVIGMILNNAGRRCFEGAMLDDAGKPMSAADSLHTLIMEYAALFNGGTSTCATLSREVSLKPASQEQAHQPSEPHLFEFWWQAHMPQATQTQAWKAWADAQASKGATIEATQQATRTTADTLREIKAASCKDCGASGYTDPGEADSPDGPGRPAVVCGACRGTGWRDGVHISDQQATPEPSTDVRTILLSIVPGDGNGQEVYAKSVDDVVAKLTELSEREESLSTQAELLTAAVEARGREIAKLKAAPEPVGEPIKWWNGCDKSVPDALRFLANNPRPAGGSDRYNAEHLFQLAGEIERMARQPLFTHPAPGVPEIDYQALIHAAWGKHKYAQGTGGCIAFKRGAEWFRDIALAAAQAKGGGNG